MRLEASLDRLKATSSSVAMSVQMLGESSTTPITARSPRFTAAIRQPPARVVHPVLTPYVPGVVASIRLWLTQSFAIVGAAHFVQCVLVATIDANVGLRSAARASSAWSSAVERLWTSSRPEALAYVVEVMPSARAFSFASA